MWYELQPNDLSRAELVSALKEAQTDRAMYQEGYFHDKETIQTLTDKLHTVWREIWIQRFDAEEADFSGPDNFYHGITRAARTVHKIQGKVVTVEPNGDLL